MHSPGFLIGGGISLLVSIICFFIAARSRRLLEEMWAVDTYAAKDLGRLVRGGFDATVEVEGTVSCEKPVLSLAARIPCCYYQTVVYREERRTRVVRSRGPGGRWRTRTVVDYQWIPTVVGNEWAVFKVHDKTGYAIVDPRQAKIDTKTVCKRDQFHQESWFAGLVGLSDTGRYRIEEKAFLPEGYVYVLGEATESSCLPLVRYPKKGYLEPKKKFFIISRRSEKEITRSRLKKVRILTWISSLGVLGAVACALLYFRLF
jgi:hypothetical protein